MHNLIVHVVIKDTDDQILIIRRTKIKRGKVNFEGGRWDIPGGTVENLEIPSVAAEREAKEEVDIDVSVMNILYEKSNLDIRKNEIFTILIYSCKTLSDCNSITLQEEEHDAYKWVTKEEILAMGDDELVSYMKEVIAIL